MKLFLYKIFLRLIIYLFWAIYPFTRLIFSSLIPWANKRKAFELKNLKDPASRKHIRADYCFEVSSEGELEQVMPLIEYFLNKKNKVELVFSSPSVEKKIEALAGRYPENLYIYRLPIIAFSPFFNLSWIKAEVLILCRYDFYPHLILEGLKKKKFVLLSASLKGKKNPSNFPYCFFDLIVCASDVEKKNFEKLQDLKVPLFTMDLRVMRILSRLERSSQALEKISSYQKSLESIPYSSRIIFGSFYPEEAKIFENKTFLKMISDKKLHICIVPHHLDQENIKKILDVIPRELVTTVVRDNSAVTLPDVAIVTITGILCELYSLFAHAYVGGGHLKSIHSVLEPYLAGSKVYCGPKTFRSTEFDFVTAHSKENISVVTNLPDFYDVLDWEKKNKNSFDFKDDLKKIILFLEDGRNL